jgi:Flp pilus assembly pilin Flp
VTSIEYVMIASLIAVVILAAVASLGAQVCERFRSVATALGAVGVPACA